MADKEDPAGLTPEERAYFTSRGEKDIPVPPPAPEPAVPEAPEPVAEAPAPSSPAEAEADKEPPVQDLKADRQTTVPHAALQEERKRRQDAEERVRQAELMQARMEERFKLMMEPAKPAPAPKPPPPRPDQDIFGAVDYLSKEIDRRGQEIDGYKQRLAAEDRQKQMIDWARAHEAAFVKDHPDYEHALGYNRMGRSLELQALGVEPSQVTEVLNKEERDLMQRAAAMKKSPAELAYNLAKARGYSKEAVERAMAAQRPQADPNKRLDMVEAGQKQSGSMSSVGGAGARASGDVTLKDLASMPWDDFVAFKEKHPKTYARIRGKEH